MVNKLMHDYDVQKALYQSSRIHGPYGRSSGPRSGKILPYSKVFEKN